MGYLKDLYRFINKLNKKSTPYVISDEVITLEAGKWEGFLNHDNVLEQTIEIYTQPNKQGDNVLNYTIELKDETWKTFIRVFGSSTKLYVTYETLGDTVEAEDINNLQWAVDKLDVGLEETTANLNKHTSNSEIHITQAERVAWNNKVDRGELELTNELLNEHKNNKMNPHNVTKEQLQLERVDNVQQASKEEFNLHKENNSNPHNVTKDQVGLGNVDNIKQAPKVDFDNHKSDSVVHITSSERNSWNDKYTRAEVDNKLSALETKIDWKESVATFEDIATTYPSPVDGWTVNVKDTDYTYRYNGTEWVVISANAIPKATTEVDGLLSKEDKVTLDDVNSKKHTHSNKSIIDTITSVLISNWNSAFAHVSDTIKHITSAERTLWNTVSNKVDKETGKGLSTNDFTTVEKNKLAGIAENANNYVHPTSHDASMIVETTSKRFVSDTEKTTWSNKASTSTATSTSNGLMSSTDKSKLDGITANATKTEASTTNGKIKINGTETTVYTHPMGTNPHGTTKADVGLGNVDNTSDLNKPISKVTQTALNGKADISHEHNQYVTKDDLGEAGYGDMMKSVYDTNNSGVVDKAESVAWTGITGKPSTFPPSTHTHDYLPLSGGTVSGKLKLNNGSFVATCNAGAGTGGYIKILQLKINNKTYPNQPIVIKLFQRATRLSTLTIRFHNNQSTDPNVDVFYYIGDVTAYIHKVDTGTWDIYVKKRDNYESISITELNKGEYMDAVTITQMNELVTELPSGYINATLEPLSIGGNASTTTKLQTARTITIGSKGKTFDGSANLSFTLDEIGALPKTGVTWNDLKGV